MNKRKRILCISLALFYAVLLICLEVKGRWNEWNNQIAVTPIPESGSVTFRGAMVDGAWYNPQDIVVSGSEGWILNESDNTLISVNGQSLQMRLSKGMERRLVFNIGPEEGNVDVRVGGRVLEWDLCREETNDVGESFLLPYVRFSNPIKLTLAALGGLFILAVVMGLCNMRCRSNMKTPPNNRNSAIELMRFFIALCVLLHHYSGLTPGGYLGVDFFFVLGGFLLMRHFTMHYNPDASEAAVTAAQYTWKRYLRLLPYYLFAFLLSLSLSVCLSEGGSLAGMITVNFWELTMLEAFGFSENLVIGPGWYCSALLIAGFCVYFLLEKNKKVYLYCIAPLSLLLIFVWMQRNIGHLNRWLQFDSFISTGTLRGFAEMGLGCICYEITTKIRGHKNHGSWRWFSTLLELICFVYIIRMIFKDAPSERDFVCVFAMAALITSLFVGGSLWSELVQNRIAQYLGSISLGVYLLHVPMQQINWTNFGAHYGLSWGASYVLYILAVIILAAISTPFVENVGAWIEAGTNPTVKQQKFGKPSRFSAVGPGSCNIQSDENKSHVLAGGSGKSKKISDKAIGNYEKAGRCFFTLVMTVGAVWVAVHQPFTYDVDNYFISMVINGCYSATDNYVKYMHPLLCRILFFFHKLYPGADWFTLFIRIMLVAGIGWISYWISVRIKDGVISGAIGFCILATVAACNIFGANFTVYAAIFVFFGAFSIFTAFRSETKRKRLIIVGSLFLALGIMIRAEGALIMTPFLCLKVLFNFISGPRRVRKKSLTRDIKALAFPCLLILTLMLGNHLFYALPDRADEQAYNAGLSPIVNYPVKSWEEACEALPDISENDYALIRSWNFSDTEIINSAYLKTISDVAAIRPQWNMASVSDGNRVVLRTLRSGSVIVYTVWILFLFISLIPCKLSKYERLESLFAVCGGYVIMLYFAVMGRFPERICIAMCLPVIAILFDNLLNALPETNLSSPKMAITGVAAILISGIYFYSQFPLQNRIYLSSFANTSASEVTWRSAYQEDAIYLCEGAYLMQFAGQSRLPSGEFMRHFVSVGDWTYGQNYHKDYLNQLGIPNPMHALLTREKTYLLGGDPSCVLRFLQEHYASDTAVEQVGDINKIPLWQFFRS